MKIKRWFLLKIVFFKINILEHAWKICGTRNKISVVSCIFVLFCKALEKNKHRNCSYGKIEIRVKFKNAIKPKTAYWIYSGNETDGDTVSGMQHQSFWISNESGSKRFNVHRQILYSFILVSCAKYGLSGELLAQRFLNLTLQNRTALSGKTATKMEREGKIGFAGKPENFGRKIICERKVKKGTQVKCTTFVGDAKNVHLLVTCERIIWRSVRSAHLCWKVILLWTAQVNLM